MWTLCSCFIIEIQVEYNKSQTRSCLMSGWKSGCITCAWIVNNLFHYSNSLAWNYHKTSNITCMFSFILLVVPRNKSISCISTHTTRFRCRHFSLGTHVEWLNFIIIIHMNNHAQKYRDTRFSITHLQNPRCFALNSTWKKISTKGIAVSSNVS